MLPTISDRRIRVAVVGCGRISGKHFEAINQHADSLELAAVCEIDPKRLTDHETKYGVQGFTEMSEMLRTTNLDLAILCTPSGLHPDQTLQASQTGVNVLTEKPMATRWADGLRMVKACDEAAVRLFVVKQNRHNSTLQLLKRAVTENRFGRIHMVALNVFWTRPQSYYDAASWRGTWEWDGGAFMNQASHYIDLLSWLIGPVDTVQAMMATLERDIEAEDSGVLNVKWRNGAMGSVSVTMLTYPQNLEGSITILGEKGSVKVGGVAVNEIQTWEFEDERDYDAAINDASYETSSVYGFGHPIYYKNVVDVMRGMAEPATDGRSGLKSLEVLIAAYRSARDGVSVSLPLEC